MGASNNELKLSLYSIDWPFTSRYGLLMYAFLIFFLLFICCVLSKRERLKKSGYNKHHKSIILVLFFISLSYSVDAFQGNCALVTYPHINEFNRFYLFFTTDFFRCCLSIFSSFFSFYNFLRLPLYFFLYFDFIFVSTLFVFFVEFRFNV